jgi:hypothetical protein
MDRDKEKIKIIGKIVEGESNSYRKIDAQRKKDTETRREKNEKGENGERGERRSEGR